MGSEASKKIHTRTDPDGCIYNGEVDTDELPNGNGWLMCPNGVEYNGEWKSGKFHGTGRYYWDRGQYDGGFRDGKQHGDGFLFFHKEEERCYYQAQFVDGLRNGAGKETCVSNENYSGDADHRKAHETRVGKKYFFFNGFYKDGKYEGQSTLRYAGGRKVKGMFKDNQLDGKAALREEDGTLLRMTFRKGEIHGKTIIYRPKDGSVHESQWVDGKQVGEPKLIPRPDSADQDISMDTVQLLDENGGEFDASVTKGSTKLAPQKKRKKKFVADQEINPKELHTLGLLFDKNPLTFDKK